MCCYLWHNRNLTRQNVKFVRFANKFFFTYSAGLTAYAAICYVAAAIKLPEHKNS